MANLKTKSLTHKIILLFAISAAVSLVLFFVLFSAANSALDKTFLNENFIDMTSAPLASRFFYYVNENGTSSHDTLAIDNWVNTNNIDYLEITKDNAIVYDSADFYDASNIYGQSLNSSFGLLKYLRLPEYNVRFSDGDATIRIYKNVEHVYYLSAYALVTLISVCVGFAIVFLVIRREVAYVSELGAEANKMSSGLENASFSIVGNDEISELAKTLEYMRTTLIDKENNEMKMKQAQNNLVLGMAHDLRTPLTSLMAYIEVVKRQNEHEEVIKYSDKALQKAEEIKNLSNQLFDFFLINSEEKNALEITSIQYAFNDYLSEICNYLCSQGFDVDASELSLPHQNVAVSFDYIGRIMNNIQSNILKYADDTKPVKIYTKSDGNSFYISVSNTVSAHAGDSSSNGIGLKNIGSMMKKMNGECIIHTDESIFKIELVFSVL